MEKVIWLGIEIECLLNGDIHDDIDIGDYHEGEQLNSYWNTQSDSSLRNSGEFGEGLCCEFVSDILIGQKNFTQGIKSFIRTISKRGKYKLKDVLVFNKSCGCHIHISINGNNGIYSHITFEILKEMRELFFGILGKSKLRKELKASVKTQYFRSYARELKKEEYRWEDIDKSLEFNPQSENDGKGFEWRSFNLHGVETWGEFEILLNIAYSCINFLFKKRIKGYDLKQEAIRIKKKELRDALDKSVILLDTLEIPFDENKYDMEVLNCATSTYS